MLIKLLIIDISSIKSIDDISLLDAKDKKYLDSFKIEKTKLQKAVSLYLKKKYIGEYSLNEYGKPISDKVYFNISHSSNFVVFASSSSPIGVDIEQIRPFKEELKKFISSDEEYNLIRDNESFFKIWTSKESLAKADGKGLATVVKNIPALPFVGLKEYKGQSYYSNQMKINDYIISVSIQQKEPFDIEYEFEKIS